MILGILYGAVDSLHSLGRSIAQGGEMVKTRGKSGPEGRPLEILWRSGTLTGLSDAQLLSRFTEARDASAESAFRELLHRHGPMVLGVCRQILRQPHDADDAFQATFLVLVRKARSLRVCESLAPWLYGVAYRTALRARAIASRYRPADAEQIEASASSPDDTYRVDLRPLLLEELGRLPGKYRTPIVLCHLEGKTHEEAARLLDWPVGTVSGRLSRGRQLLKSRLERRGLAVPSAMLAAPSLTGIASVLTLPQVETALTAATRFAAAQPVSTSVLSLTHGVLRTMLLHKLKTIAFAVLLIGTISGGAGVWAHWPSHASRQPTQGSEPASISTPKPMTTPVPDPNPAAPQPSTKPSAGSESLVAKTHQTDCPAEGSDDCQTYCPLTMAANAFARMFAHLHDGSESSR
jgi:RNA polymerase sigma factor (sigma-70 family)